MNKAATSILASLAVMGSVIGGQAVLAQEGPLGRDHSGAAGYFAGAALPYPTEGLGDVTWAVGVPSAEFMPLAEAIPSDDLLGEPVEGEFELAPAGQPVSFGGPNWGACDVGPCCAVCGGGANCLPDWYTVQEVRVLGRRPPEDRLITSEMTITAAGTTLESRLTSRSVPLDVAAGYAVTLGRYLGRDIENRDRFLEFTYWGLNTWNNSREANGTRFTDSTSFAVPVTFGSLFTPFATTTDVYDSTVGGFNRADTHTLRYQSDIDNFEVNLRFRPRGRPDRLVLRPDGSWRRECQPGWQCDYLVGLRVTTVDEAFSLHSEGDIFYNDLSHEVSGDYTSRTQNDLIGLQFGFEAMQRQCKYTWGVRGKAGAFINCASMALDAVNSAANDPYATTDIDFHRDTSTDDAAFLGEIGLVGTYRFRPDVVLRASYDLTCIVGLASAPDQMVFSTNPASAINVNYTGVFHGLSLGFEWMW